MIDYQDFVKYADENLARSDLLFKNNDLRYAVFSAHEALELYLKAYLLKYQIISKPKDAGHLAYPAIFLKLADEFKREIRNPNTNQDKNLWLSALQHLDNMKSVINDMKDFQKCIILWKNSINITLDKNEEENLQNILKKLKQSTTTQIEKVGSFVFTPQFESKMTKPNVNPDVKQIGNIMKKYYNKSRKDVNADISGLGPELFSASQDFLTGKKTGLSQQVVSSILKQFAILRTMNWMPMMVYSFSHQQISRYPTQIGNSTADKLYQENKKSVEEFLQKINATCNEINSSLSKLF